MGAPAKYINRDPLVTLKIYRDKGGADRLAPGGETRISRADIDHEHNSHVRKWVAEGRLALKRKPRKPRSKKTESAEQRGE